MSYEEDLIDYLADLFAKMEAYSKAGQEALHAVPARESEQPIFTCARCNKRIKGEPMHWYGKYYHATCYQSELNRRT